MKSELISFKLKSEVPDKFEKCKKVKLNQPTNNWASHILELKVKHFDDMYEAFFQCWTRQNLQRMSQTDIYMTNFFKIVLFIHVQVRHKKCQFIYTSIFFFLNRKFYQEARKLGQKENCNKTANNANNTIIISITTLIPLWYPKVNPFWPFLHHFSQ